jgi:hypothetical protein
VHVHTLRLPDAVRTVLRLLHLWVCGGVGVGVGVGGVVCVFGGGEWWQQVGANGVVVEMITSAGPVQGWSGGVLVPNWRPSPSPNRLTQRKPMYGS